MLNMNGLICRTAENDFEAFLTAKAMQALNGVDVFVIVDSRPMWRVFAKFDTNTISISEIDAAVDAALDKLR